jgi:hypothetical protein
MVNAEFQVEWISPNGAVTGTDRVAAYTPDDARKAVQAERGDDYFVGKASLLGDLPEEHPSKYDTPATVLKRAGRRVVIEFEVEVPQGNEEHSEKIAHALAYHLGVKFNRDSYPPSQVPGRTQDGLTITMTKWEEAD